MNKQGLTIINWFFYLFLNKGKLAKLEILVHLDRIINLPVHAMKGKSSNITQSHHYQNQFPQKMMITQRNNPNRTSLNLRRRQEINVDLEEGFEFDCFKDDNLRVRADCKPEVEKTGIHLFRKQKKMKWMDALNEEQETQKPRQSHALNEQKISPLAISIDHYGKNSTILNHRATSQGLARQIYTSLERKRQKFTKKTSSTIKFHGKKHQTSLDRYKQIKDLIQQRQIKFQIQSKPMIDRLATRSKHKTKQDLKRIYSPSKIFRKLPKSSRDPAQTQQEQDMFKAWQQSEELASDQFEDYTQELFSCETLDMRPARPLQRKVISRRI